MKTPVRLLAVTRGLALTLLMGLAAGVAPSQSVPAPVPSPIAVASPVAGPAGSVRGTVVDPTGAAIAGAQLTVLGADHSPAIEVRTSGDGEFQLTGVQAGSGKLSVSAAGFAAKVVGYTLQPGEDLTLPEISLSIATSSSVVVVTPPAGEVAEEQMHVEERQRLLGAIPNYYVTYVPNAAPLSAPQKFRLASKFTLDPASFAIAGVIAGVQQANRDFEGYGQGAQGYLKRYGAAYADFFIGTVLSNAVLPSLLKQDPRYFYKGTGTKRSRAFYAIANSAVCKGDNGRWQPNYSSIGGGLAAGGISNLYYPAKDRNGAALTFENAAIGIAGTAVGNLAQEFLFRRLTPHATP